MPIDTNPWASGVVADVGRLLAGIADDLAAARLRAQSLSDEVQWDCMAALRFCASATTLAENLGGLADQVDSLRWDAASRLDSGTSP